MTGKKIEEKREGEGIDYRDGEHLNSKVISVLISCGERQWSESVKDTSFIQL